MLSARHLTSQLLRRKVTLPYGLVLPFKSGYHWGNYDVTPGQCPKMRLKDITECSANYSKCKPADKPQALEPKKEDDYAKHLLLLLRSKEFKCDLFKHDESLYQPSDKRRRYQRTWPECPMPVLKLKKTCCFNKEQYPPICRRPRPAPLAELTPIDKHAYHMSLLCKGCKAGAKRKCRYQPKLKCCERALAPYPSFSECEKKCMRRYCPTECACKLRPSLCEMWAVHHRNHGYYKKCTEAIVGYCPFKRRSRFLN